MSLNFLRCPLGLPLLTCIFEIAHQFLLLRIRRNHRLGSILKSTRLFIDEVELLVSTRMISRAFFCLSIGLQAAAQLSQQVGYFLPTHHMTLIFQCRGKLPVALARPAKWRLGIASRNGIYQSL